MNPKSAKALVWAALLVLLLAAAVGAPAGAFSLAVTAGLLVVAPAVSAPKRTRLFAVLLLLAAAALAAAVFPAFRKEGDAYRQRAKAKAEAPAPVPSSPEGR